MPGPATGVRFIHFAMEREAAALEDAAGRLANGAMARTLAERLAFFESVNELHTEGEEVAIFPALEERLKHHVGPYLLDHIEERARFREIHGLLDRLAASDAPDLEVKARLVRQTASLRDGLALHIRKENEILVPLVESLFSPAEQAAMVGKAIAHFPPDQMQFIMPWLVSWLDPPDREAYLRDLITVMPPAVLATATGWLKRGLAPDAWADLKARLPQLPG